MFSPPFFQILILGALCWTALGAITLVVLLVVDWIKGTLW